MVHTGQIKLFGIAIMAALAAFVMAMAIAPAAQAADVSQDQAAPQAMQDNGDDDDNGVVDDDDNGITDDDDNGVTDDDDNGVTDDENGVMDDDNGVMDDEDGVTDDDEDLAPAETGGAGLLGSSTGTALGGLLLGLGALAALMTAGRFATRQQ